MSNARDISDAGHRLVAFTRFSGASVTASATDKDDLKNYFGIDGVEDQGSGQYRIHLISGIVSDANYTAVMGFIPDVFTNNYSATTRVAFIETYNVDYLDVHCGYQGDENNGYIDFDISVAIFN